MALQGLLGNTMTCFFFLLFMVHDNNRRLSFLNLGRSSPMTSEHLALHIVSTDSFTMNTVENSRIHVASVLRLRTHVAGADSMLHEPFPSFSLACSPDFSFWMVC